MSSSVAFPQPFSNSSSGLQLSSAPFSGGFSSGGFGSAGFTGGDPLAFFGSSSAVRPFTALASAASTETSSIPPPEVDKPAPGAEDDPTANGIGTAPKRRRPHTSSSDQAEVANSPERTVPHVTAGFSVDSSIVASAVPPDAAVVFDAGPSASATSTAEPEPEDDRPTEGKIARRRVTSPPSAASANAAAQAVSASLLISSSAPALSAGAPRWPFTFPFGPAAASSSSGSASSAATGFGAVIAAAATAGKSGWGLDSSPTADAAAGGKERSTAKAASDGQHRAGDDVEGADAKSGGSSDSEAGAGSSSEDEGDEEDGGSGDAGGDVAVGGSGSGLRLAASLDGGAARRRRRVLAAASDSPQQTGEEHEHMLLQLWAKIFVLDRGRSGAAASAPSSSANASSAVSSGETQSAPVLSPAPAPRWRECGFGPVRVNVRRDVGVAHASQLTAAGLPAVPSATLPVPAIVKAGGGDAAYPIPPASPETSSSTVVGDAAAGAKSATAEAPEPLATAALAPGSAPAADSAAENSVDISTAPASKAPVAAAAAASDVRGASSLTGPAARLVMRQEVRKGGRGTRLLLNAALFPGMRLGAHASDARAVQFSALVTPDTAPPVFANADVSSGAGIGSPSGGPASPSRSTSAPAGTMSSFLLRFTDARDAARFVQAAQLCAAWATSA